MGWSLFFFCLAQRPSLYTMVRINASCGARVPAALAEHVCRGSYNFVYKGLSGQLLVKTLFVVFVWVCLCRACVRLHQRVCVRVSCRLLSLVHASLFRLQLRMFKKSACVTSDYK